MARTPWWKLNVEVHSKANTVKWRLLPVFKKLLGGYLWKDLRSYLKRRNVEGLSEHCLAKMISSPKWKPWMLAVESPNGHPMDLAFCVIRLMWPAKERNGPLSGCSTKNEIFSKTDHISLRSDRVGLPTSKGEDILNVILKCRKSEVPRESVSNDYFLDLFNFYR